LPVLRIGERRAFPSHRSESELQNLGSLPRDQDVLGSQLAVHESGVVGLLDRLSDLGRHPSRVGGLHLAATVKAFREGLTLEVLEHDESYGPFLCVLKDPRRSRM